MVRGPQLLSLPLLPQLRRSFVASVSLPLGPCLATVPTRRAKEVVLVREFVWWVTYFRNDRGNARMPSSPAILVLLSLSLSLLNFMVHMLLSSTRGVSSQLARLYQ